MQTPNLFKTLSRYGSRDAEDYLTESFVLLIKELLERRSETGLRFLNCICGLSAGAQFDNADLIQLSTQVVIDAGRLDIQVKSGSDILVYIEVKHDAALANGQLEQYKAHLDTTDSSTRVLVLLTRSKASRKETTLDRSEYHAVCWYDVYRELSAIKDEGVGEVCGYLIDEFLNFLEEKQMSLERVGWEYIKGVPSFMALMTLIEVAILEVAPDVNIRKTAGSVWYGYYIGDSYFCGMRYAEPLTIVFEGNTINDPTYKQDLDLEEQHFFALNQAQQMECLVKFVQDSINGDPQQNLG